MRKVLIIILLFCLTFQVFGNNYQNIFGTVMSFINLNFQITSVDILFLSIILVVNIIVVLFIFLRFRSKQIKKIKSILKEKVKERVKDVEKKKDEIKAQRDEIELQKQALIVQKEKIEKQNQQLQEQQYELEKQVKSRTKALEEAKNKAEESDKLKTAFLTNLSHEIRTPMNAIIGFASLLSDPEITNEQRNEFVSHINHNSISLLHLIDDIIDVSRIEANKVEININECSLNVILVDLYSTYLNFKAELGKSDIDLRLVNPYKQGNIKLITDSYRFRQIFANLLNNALKYTEEGYIEFGIEIKDEKLYCYVKDTGIGIPEDKKSVIFDRFFKVEEEEGRIFRGTGVGLTLSKKLAMLLGGDLWVDTTNEVGSTFFFSIPFTPPQEEVPTLTADWQGKKILAAEDEEENFMLLKSILVKTKATIIRAKNGQEAYDTVLSNENIDIVIMDLRMPLMDGIEAAGEIRNINNDVPIIAVTAYAFSIEREQILKSGFNDLITKPLKSNILISVLKKYIG